MAVVRDVMDRWTLAVMQASVGALPDRYLAHAGDVSAAFRERGCNTIRDAALLVWTLPYGRNTDRADYRRVLCKGRGTCSTKHALIAALAVEQAIAIALQLGIYEIDRGQHAGRRAGAGRRRTGRDTRSTLLASLPQRRYRSDDSA